MKRITNLTVVAVFACLMIAFCAGSVTTFASDGHDAGLCAQCGESNDGHVGAITVEHDGEHQTFCCPSCATKYANAHREGVEGDHHEDAGHHEHKGHDEHEGH
ncbi:MAG: hypothetical protein GY781_01430 [Gammaproteobacteria bacterium]|nr:hypothetical protein [Gammaproteobacteria bacterium]